MSNKLTNIGSQILTEFDRIDAEKPLDISVGVKRTPKKKTAEKAHHATIPTPSMDAAKFWDLYDHTGDTIRQSEGFDLSPIFDAIQNHSTVDLGGDIFDEVQFEADKKVVMDAFNREAQYLNSHLPPMMTVHEWMIRRDANMQNYHNNMPNPADKKYHTTEKMILEMSGNEALQMFQRMRNAYEDEYKRQEEVCIKQDLDDKKRCLERMRNDFPFLRQMQMFHLLPWNDTNWRIFMKDKYGCGTDLMEDALRFDSLDEYYADRAEIIKKQDIRTKTRSALSASFITHENIMALRTINAKHADIIEFAKFSKSGHVDLV